MHANHGNGVLSEKGSGDQYSSIMLNGAVQSESLVCPAAIHDRQDRSSSNSEARIQGTAGGEANNGESVAAAGVIVDIPDSNDRPVVVELNTLWKSEEGGLDREDATTG